MNLAILETESLIPGKFLSNLFRYLKVKKINDNGNLSLSFYFPQII
jgi:hypothetical protein